MNFIIGLAVCIAAVIIRLAYAPKGKEYDRMFAMLLAAGAFDMLTVNGCQTFLLFFLALVQTALSAAFVWLYWANASGRINVFFTTFLKALAVKLYGKNALAEKKHNSRRQPVRPQQQRVRQQPAAYSDVYCGRYAA